jgi:hypothetical protein
MTIDTALEHKRASIMQTPGVVGVGRTQRRGQDVIVVMIESRGRAALDQIPDSIDGFPVEVDEVGMAVAL